MKRLLVQQIELKSNSAGKRMPSKMAGMKRRMADDNNDVVSKMMKPENIDTVDNKVDNIKIKTLKKKTGIDCRPSYEESREKMCKVLGVTIEEFERDDCYEDPHGLGFNWALDAKVKRKRSPNENISKSIIYKKNNFKKMLLELEITNEQQYQHNLKINDELAYYAYNFKGCNLESIKRNCYEISRQTIKVDDYKSRVAMHKIDDENDKDYIIGLACTVQILQSIAKENQIKYQDLLYNIFTIMNMSRHKVNTLIFVGSSDSGKSFIADLFTSPFEQYEIGQFALPTASKTNQFWLEPLIGKQIYRAEELYISDSNVMQQVKKLFEGSPALIGEIKYKSALTIQRRPVIVSMNGDSEYSVTRGMSNEFDTIANRSFIYTMNGPVKDRYHMGSLKCATKYGRQIVNTLYSKYGNTDVNLKNDDDIDLMNDYLKENF